MKFGRKTEIIGNSPFRVVQSSMEVQRMVVIHNDHKADADFPGTAFVQSDIAYFT